MKNLLLATAFIFALAGCSKPADDIFPNQDIEVIIPYNAGGGFDAYARSLAQYMQRHLPSEVNVLPVNMPGAGGRRGAAHVYRADPDGYTIGIFNMPGILLPQIQGIKIAYDVNQLTWLSTLSSDGYGIIVDDESPINSIDDLKNLGRNVVYGATGPSSTSYIATTIVSTILEIPYEVITGYKGSGEYILGVIRGDVDAAFANYSTIQPYLESGDVKVVAMIGVDSDDPNIKDANDLGVPELSNLNVVRMMAGPPGMPEDVKNTLEKAMMDALNDPQFKAWLESTGNDATPMNSIETTNSVNDMMFFYDKFKQFLE
jgi:tripartite-type tricarboxylate transporter receptor subunit TctC